MPVNKEKYKEIVAELGDKIQLVAVSKTQSPDDIQTLYGLGQRDFGENYVQDLVDKQLQLPKDIQWHFIGHLQSNKVKYIVPFVYLIQGVDSLKLLTEINKQAVRYDRVVNCLLQVHIAAEETKFGFDEIELMKTLNNPELPTLNNIRICGLMGMGSFTENMDKVRNEFKYLKSLFEKCAKLPAINNPISTLSMGMSHDYTIAIQEGTTMVRIGSLVFGERV